jgi:hypothetical protein
MQRLPEAAARSSDHQGKVHSDEPSRAVRVVIFEHPHESMGAKQLGDLAQRDFARRLVLAGGTPIKGAHDLHVQSRSAAPPLEGGRLPR